MLVSIPHTGHELPEEVCDGMTHEASSRRDTDWHLERLYDFVQAMGATVVQARYSRYVIDLNRPPTGESLYPGQATTGLCPTETFAGERLYQRGREPNADEVEHRLQRYWRPYHDALAAELVRLRSLHGEVLLWDAHSIASRVPRLFEGTLPSLNFGTNSGSACAQKVLDPVVQRCQASGLSWVINGRFKGGYITRCYGHPTEGVQAIQLEMCQSLYMDEEGPPFQYRAHRAEALKPVLHGLIEAAISGLQPSTARG